jgi:hypothetical protein
MGDKLTVLGDHQCIPLVAHANLVHHPPHFFQADLTHQGPGAIAQLRQLDANNCGRQEIVVDAIPTRVMFPANFVPDCGNSRPSSR